ncbi:hypothetical protein IH824_19635 [candidate division KSB1 bacterium]|nr:hypothetical protein [candidate division KSB1 bacterium]
MMSVNIKEARDLMVCGGTATPWLFLIGKLHQGRIMLLPTINTGSLLFDLGRFEEALVSFRKS